MKLGLHLYDFTWPGGASQLGPTLDSGSLEQDGSLGIVAMEEEEQARLMHDHRLGKGQHHAHKTSQTLPQGVIPPLHMGGFSRLFSHSCMYGLPSSSPRYPRHIVA